jgi:CubicO group peptidase (beta-lactamase class C family)
MRQFIPTTVLACGLIAITAMWSDSEAQRAQSTSVQRAPVAVSLQRQDITVRQAMQDNNVRSEVSRAVRNIDVRDLTRQTNTTSTVPANVGNQDDAPPRSLRLMDANEISVLANPEGSRVSSRAVSTARTPTAANARIENILRQTRPTQRPDIRDLAAPPQPYLDVQGFADDLHAALENSVRGYEMRMRRNGQTIYTLQWNWAQTPADDGLPWGPDRRMHIVSISKLITAMGLTHLLDAEGIDFNTPIINYLPDYWNPGSNVQNITFAHLMNHRSGINTGNNSDASYQRMRNLIENGVAMPGPSSGYSNANFALCRILMATIAGYIDTDADFGPMNDLMWNYVTTLAYADYIEDNVFAPAGVLGPTLDNTPQTARAYAWNDNGQGWDSSNPDPNVPSGGTALFGQAGGVAWHMSPDELLDVVGEFRRGGDIVSPARAREIFDASYGLNSAVNGNDSPAGRFYFKPGKWGTSTQAEQALIMILPEQIEVAIFVSSQIGPNDASLQNLGRTLYVNNVIEP